MERDYTEFAIESANRAIKWIHRYEEGIRFVERPYGYQVLLKGRIKKLELAIKNFNQAIEEVEVEVAYLNRELV